MVELPSPLTPPECDLQDFSFMPLQVSRLRDSDFAAEVDPEACWYAVLLWAAAWHQVPAGSLPENDILLMRICGLGRDTKTWKRHREGALRGFVKCSDGRLYHNVVCEQANEAWKQKLQQRWRTEISRIRKANERNKTDLACPTYDEFVAGLSHTTEKIVAHDNEAMSHEKGIRQSLQGTGTGTGTVIREETTPKPLRTESAKKPNPAKVDPHPTLVAVMSDGGFITQPSDWKTQLQIWKDLGADFDHDILPSLRKVAREIQERGTSPPRMLKFFDGAVREKLAADQREIDGWRERRLQREAVDKAQIQADIDRATSDLATCLSWLESDGKHRAMPPRDVLEEQKLYAERQIETGLKMQQQLTENGVLA